MFLFDKYLLIILFDLQIDVYDRRHLQEWFDDACKDDDIYLAGRLLALGASIDFIDVDKSYPLSRACAADNVSLVQFLLAHGADVNRTRLALAEACGQENGSVEVLNLLLDAGADVNLWPLDDKHPMSIAYKSGNLATTELLMSKYKCSPVFGCKGLCRSCGDSAMCVAIFLLDKCVSTNHRKYSRNSMDPRVCAVTGYLMKYKSRVGKCLVASAASRCLDTVRAIVDGGGNVDAKVKGDTALTVAMQTPFKPKTLELITLLIDHEADVNTTGSTGYTPLIFACNTPEPPPTELITLLLNRGADINKACHSRSPLSCAIGHKHYGLMTRLCVLGAAADHFALHATIDLGDSDIPSLLIDRGADVNALSADRLTPLLRVARITPFSKQCLNIAVLLLYHGADVESKDGYGLTALCRLCRGVELSSHQAIVINRLIDSGANVDAVDNKGCNALNHLICGSCDAPTIELLLKHNVNTSRYCVSGDTPLISLVKRSARDRDLYMSALKLLLRHDADANTPNYMTGDTALMAACRHEDTRLVKLLLEHGADVTAVNHKGESVADIIGNTTRMVQLHVLCNQYVDCNIPKNVLK